MPRPTKIRQAKSAEDFRDAVVERWRQIWRRAPPTSPVQDPDEPLRGTPPPPARSPRTYPGGRVFKDLPPRHGLGRGVFDDDD
jgi:hypothetical protein